MVLKPQAQPRSVVCLEVWRAEPPESSGRASPLAGMRAPICEFGVISSLGFAGFRSPPHADAGRSCFQCDGRKAECQDDPPLVSDSRVY